MNRLRDMLQRIDGKGYKAYKGLQGTYHFPTFVLYVDYVQGDPFASPSRIRLRMAQTTAQYETDWFQSHHRKVALQDFIARQLATIIQRRQPTTSGTGKSGLMMVDRPGQAILERTAVVVTSDYVEARIAIGLPARGRRVLGRQATKMLIGAMPQIVAGSLPATAFDRDKLTSHLQLVDNQQAIRNALSRNGWVTFVANGALLPRKSGVNDRPLTEARVVRFQSPPSLEKAIPIPHGKPVKGMVLPQGIHLIVGGGYHGKSTLLNAIEHGVYDHIAGDGREYVLTERSSVHIRAEDGRRVEKVNIAPFINNLPFGQETERFSTDDASGSTSQAANIIEALEMGSCCLLIDEDTSATNFMIRDGRMQQLVAKEREPITPFVDRVRDLLAERRVSTVLVLGGSGDYFDVADTVILMDEYLPYDVTSQAQEIMQQSGQARQSEGGVPFNRNTARAVLASGFQARRGKKEKIEAKGLHRIVYGRTDIHLSALDQLVDPSQTRAIAEFLRLIAEKANGRTSLRECIESLYEQIEQEGLDVISRYYGAHPGDLALPRKFEVAAAVNRLRTLSVKSYRPFCSHQS